MRSPSWQSRPFGPPTGAALAAVALALACNLEPTALPPSVDLDPLPSLAVAAAETKGGSWETRAPVPTGRLNFGAGVITNPSGVSIFYAIGGENGRRDATTNIVQAYNPVTNTWVTKARLPDDRVYPNGTGVINGKLYLTGGYDGATPTIDMGLTSRTLFLYDPIANTWSQKKVMPVSSAAGVTGVINGQLYVLTGIRLDCALDCPFLLTQDLYRYDPSTDTWRKLARAPNVHAGGVGGVINGKFYVAGGGGVTAFRRDLDVYDPATNTWTSKAPMPTTREPGATGAVVGERLYLTGGGTSVVEAYEPATNTWTRVADAPDPARWFQAAGTIRNTRGDEQMIVVGARPEEPHFGPGETWVYTPFQQKMAFTTNRDGNSEIYLMRADGRLQKNLSNSPRSDFGQAWSTSGNKIVFQSDRDGNAEIYSMGVNGLDQKNLTRNPALDAGAKWRRDGRMIAFHSNRNGNFEIYIMREDGVAPTRLTNDPGFDRNPIWSPSGTRIAFERTPATPGSHGDIYIMNASGSVQTNLTRSPDAEDSWPRWSPDESKIAFVRGGPDGSQDVYVMNRDGSGLTNLSGNAAHESAPDWSPDGRRIAFERGGDIWVMNANGSDQRQLTNTSASEIIPHWSPDGSRIAFTSRRDGNDEIYVMYPDGSGQKNITRRPSGDTEPAWSP